MPAEPSAFAAAQWLGLLGAGLIATASGIVGFTGRPLLGALGPALGLAVATACCVVVSRHFRRTAPLVGRVIAHLGRLIGAVTVAAAVAAATPWAWVPAAFGSALAMTSTGWRLGGGWGRAGISALAAGGVAVTVAATTPLPLGALLAVIAALLVVAPCRGGAAARERLGTLLGVLALAAPLGGLPGRWRLGDGTLARLGLRDDVLAVAAPAAGIVGGAALLVVAARRGSAVTAHLALAGAALNVAVAAGWDGWDAVSSTTWLGATFAAGQLLIAAGRRDPFWRLTLRVPAVVVLAAGSLLAMRVIRELTAAVVHGESDLALLAAPLLLAAGLTLTRSDVAGRNGPQLAAAGLVTLGAGAATGSLTAAAVAALGTVLCSLVGRSSPVVVTSVVIGSGLVAVPAQLVDGTIAADAVAATVVVVAGWMIGRRAGTAETLGVVTAAVAAGAASRTTAELVPTPVAMAIAAGVAGSALVASRRAGVTIGLAGPATLAIAATFSVIASVNAGAERAEHFTAAASSLAAAAFAAALIGLVGWWRRAPGTGHMVTAALAVGTPALAAGAGFDLGLLVTAVLLVGIATAGAAFSRPTFGPADTGALAGLAAAALFGWTGGHPVPAWIALVAIGLAIGLHGLCRLDVAVAVGGGVVSSIGAAGLVDQVDGVRWLIERLGGLGLSNADIATSIVVVALAAGGAIATALRPATPSWWTWGPASGLATAYLLATIAADGRPDTRLLVAITVSVGLVVAGAVCRAAAPLVLGTMSTIGTVTLASWTTLTSLPAWAWIAGGGVALLTVAAIVERQGRTTGGDGGDEADGAGNHVVRRVLTTFR